MSTGASSATNCWGSVNGARRRGRVGAAAVKLADVMGFSHSPAACARPSGQNISDLVEQAAVDGQGLEGHVSIATMRAPASTAVSFTPGTGLDICLSSPREWTSRRAFEYQSLKTRIDMSRSAPCARAS